MAKSTVQALTLWGLAGVYATPSRLSARGDSELAQTPPMGWNSYNHYRCSPNQDIVKSNAQALVDLGLTAKGYHYVTVDCGWTVPQRDANGKMTWNPDRFPDGFPKLAEFVHGLQLGFGVYADAGIKTCMDGHPEQAGSLGRESIDAVTFADWGADLLKYDNCFSSADKDFPSVDYTPAISPRQRFEAMGDALHATGRQILYQICEWGVDFPTAWAPEAGGQTWRISNDILPSWPSIWRILNQFVPSADSAGPGHWPDLDMLLVGNDKLTEPEEQTHFSMWAIAKSPLFIGARLKDGKGEISKSSLAILLNKEVISFHQDSLGKAANLRRRYTDAGLDVWSGPLSADRVVAALINWNDHPVDAKLALPDVGLQSAEIGFDVWAHKLVRDIKTSYKARLEAHGVLLLELARTTPAGTYPASLFTTPGDPTMTHFTDIYGITDSANYSLKINIDPTHATSPTITITTSATTAPMLAVASDIIMTPDSATIYGIPFKAVDDNTLEFSGFTGVSAIEIMPPEGAFYPSIDFNLAGGAKLVDCVQLLCGPVGWKIVDISPTASATITIPVAPGEGIYNRYVEITYINNDVAMESAWNGGTNTRGLSIAVNGAKPVRLDTPLTGKSSELYSPMKGWGDTATLGVLVPGFGTGKNGRDDIVVSNVGDTGQQKLGADFVGLKVI